MVSLRKPSMGTTYIKEKQVSKWEGAMKKFSEAHKETCKTAPLDPPPKFQRIVKNFSTGSRYEGSWDVLGMSGYGDYIYPNGVEYEGEFEDSLLHGKGELRYKTEEGESVIRGKWNKGVLTERTLLFSDSLEYNERNWKYCMMPDRRFAIEYDIDLMPAGKSFMTAEQPTRPVPDGYYDTGDGFYDPKTHVVYKYKDLSAIKRAPSIREQKWIVDNCRTSPETPLGPRPDLYERFLEPSIQPQPQPPPAAGIKTATITSFRKQSLFEQDLDFDNSRTDVFYDSSKRVSAEFRLEKPTLVLFKPGSNAPTFRRRSS